MHQDNEDQAPPGPLRSQSAVLDYHSGGINTCRRRAEGDSRPPIDAIPPEGESQAAADTAAWCEATANRRALCGLAAARRVELQSLSGPALPVSDFPVNSKTIQNILPPTAVLASTNYTYYYSYDN